MKWRYIKTPLVCIVYIVFPEFCKQTITGVLLSGMRTHNLCNSRALSYQLDHRDCLVDRNSFFHRAHERTEYTVLTHIGVWVNTNMNKTTIFFVTQARVYCRKKKGSASVFNIQWGHRGRGPPPSKLRSRKIHRCHTGTEYYVKHGQSLHNSWDDTIYLCAETVEQYTI